MRDPTKPVLRRRAFLGKIAVGSGAAAALASPVRSGFAAAGGLRLEAGEGVRTSSS